MHFIYIHVHNCRFSLLLGKKNNYYEPVMPLKLQHTYSDHHLFSPGSVILEQFQIMRIKGLITKDKINWLGFSKNPSQLTTITHVGNLQW